MTLCWLLGIKTDKELAFHPLRGQIFETMIIADAYKYFLNKGEIPNLYFWRDSKGLEVDLLIERGDTLYPIEIKSGETIFSNMFKNIQKWCEISNEYSGEPKLIYGGNEFQQRTGILVVSWRNIEKDAYIFRWKIE